MQTSGSTRRPLVTIAIPTFNRVDLLKGCIDSALTQSYDNIEVLVSDNASTDDTEKLVQIFSDQRLRYLRHQHNIGLLPNWNFCLSAAKGEYIVLLSDDDRISPRMIERSIAHVRQQPDLPIVVTLSNLHALSLGVTRPARVSSALASGIHKGTDILMAYLKDELTVTMCSVVLRTEALRARGGFPLDYPHTADVAAWAPLLLLGNAGLVNEATATYAYHATSETSRLGVEARLCDGWKVAALISEVAAQHVNDSTRHGAIREHAQRCFARRGFIALSDYYKSGGNLSTLAKFTWRFRGQLMHAGLMSLLRLAGSLLCPQPLVDWVRRHQAVAREQFT